MPRSQPQKIDPAARLSEPVRVSGMECPHQFGKYRLLKRLATGGMAEIFLARQGGLEGFEKDVVVKRLLAVHSENEQLVEMFLDEARIAANLTHPNITQIFDLGREGNDYFIAMEYVHGVDLRRLCSQGIAEANYLPLRHGVRIIAEVCDALAYAHERSKDGVPMGIVHRDVSPTNILVTFEGGVKLVDFGIAKAADKASVTRAGQVKGKLGYMSPEQVRGEAVDARSDIFALGINLFEICLGRRLFKAASDTAALDLIERCEVPSPREIVEGFPDQLDRIILKCLARDPDERYASARQIQMELEEFLAAEGLRSTAGMLSDYLRQLFREQLELERQEGPALSGLSQTFESAVALRDSTAVVKLPAEVAAARHQEEAARGTEPSPELAAPPLPAPLHGPTLTSGRVPELERPPAEADDLPFAPVGPPADVEVSSRITASALFPPDDHDGAAQPPPVPPSVGAQDSAPALFEIDAGPAKPAGEFSKVRSRDSGLLTWQEINEPAPLPPSGGPAQPKSFDVPHGVDDVDVSMRAPRSYYGLVVVLLIAGAGYGLWHLMLRDMLNAKPRGTTINFAPPELGKTGRVDPAKLPPRPKAAPAELRISSEPPGARVVVNGNVLEALTPTTARTFAGMSSTVRILMPGYLPAEQRLDVGPDGAEVQLSLQKGVPETGKLRIETAPPGAKVKINGAEAGVTPVLHTVGAGTQLTIVLEKETFYPHVVTYTVLPGEAREIAVRMVYDTGPRKLAVVNVESIPSGARIVDLTPGAEKKVLGHTTRYPVKVNRELDRPFRLRAQAKDHAPTEQAVDVRMPFYTLYVRLPEVAKFSGSLSILGAPDLTVYVGSEEIGRTPITDHTLPEGRQTVVIFDPTSKTREQFSVDVVRNKTVEKSVVLQDGKLVVR